MADPPVIDAETARNAERVLLTVVADLLEAALDQCASADAAAQGGTIAQRSREAALVLETLSVIRARSQP